jgi:hypothetical protein
MKIKSLLLLPLLLSCYVNQAQNPDDDPLAETYIIENGGGDELVTITSGSKVRINIFKYYKATQKYACDTLVPTLSWQSESSSSGSDMDLADLDRDNLDEILAAWISNNAVQIAVFKIDPGKMHVDPDNAWEKISRETKSSPLAYSAENWAIMSDIFIREASLDADTTGEFVTAYWAEDGLIEITAYDVDDTLKISELGAIRDQLVSEPPVVNLCEDQTSLFELECVDFNGDGIDEILLTGRSAIDPDGWQVFANVYAWNENSGILESVDKKVIYSANNTGFDIGNINSASGYFHYPDTETAVVSIFEYSPYAYGDGVTWDTIANFLISLEMDHQLNEVSAWEPIFQRQDTLPPECHYSRASTLTAYDFNNDGIDELVSSFAFNGKYPTLKIYQGDPALGFSVYANLDENNGDFYGTVAVGDFYYDSQDDSELAEMIIITRESFHSDTGKMYQVQTHPDGTFDKLELINDNLASSGELGIQKKETLLAGNFDRDIRIGKPKRYSFTDILQPLVILNAPPIHFDVFDNQTYDICESYNDNTSEFVAKYIKQTEQSTEVRTEMNRDWSMSTSISSGFSFWGVSVSAYLTQTYGDKFSKVEGSSRTVTVGFEIDATVDDQIYATVVDYDLWEYPVYGDDDIKGHVLVVDPQIVKNSWFDSKSWKGYSYIPDHEVGNILSYRRYPLLSDNPLLVEKIKGDYGLETSFLLSGNTSYDWFLNFNDFSENEATTTKEYTRNWGASVSAWGSGFSLDGSYNKEDINTQRTTVESGIDLNVHLGSVDMSSGETRYEVTPYAYWASNGALVIDYAVSPELAGAGGVDTWWDEHYGYFSDPTFILPWRYDPEKGHAVSETKRKQTNDIQFYPQDPADGDTITIRSWIHNFSLLPTPRQVGVTFFLGDPDTGGTPMQSIQGELEHFTSENIPARGKALVQTRWKVPEGTPSFPRIYAVIDADNELMEIHENNNVSWNILQKTTGPVIDEIRDIIEPPKSFHAWNYPNPFSTLTRISFRLPSASKVNIAVYNTMGQHIATLANGVMTEGLHTVEFDGLHREPGIYFCMIRTGSYQQVLKLMLKE